MKLDCPKCNQVYESPAGYDYEAGDSVKCPKCRVELEPFQTQPVTGGKPLIIPSHSLAGRISLMIGYLFSALYCLLPLVKLFAPPEKQLFGYVHVFGLGEGDLLVIAGLIASSIGIAAARSQQGQSSTEDTYQPLGFRLNRNILILSILYWVGCFLGYILWHWL